MSSDRSRNWSADKVHHAVLIGEMAGRIAALWESRVPCEKAGSLEDAVQRARGACAAGRRGPVFSGNLFLRHVQKLRRPRRPIPQPHPIARMNLPFRPPKKKKPQAAPRARRPREADFTEEPNVQLSSAFVVVLVLHVVAVGGIYAFNALKAHQPPAI